MEPPPCSCLRPHRLLPHPGNFPTFVWGSSPFIWVQQNLCFLTGFPPWWAVPTCEALSPYPVHSLTGPLTESWKDVLSVGLARGGGRHGTFAPSTQHVVCRVGLRWVSTWTVWFHSARRKGSTAVLVMCLHVSVALIFTVLSLQPLPLGFQGSGCFFPLWPRWVASSPSSEQASSSRSCLLAVPFPYRHPPAHFSWQAHGFQNLLSDIFFSELFSGFV